MIYKLTPSARSKTAAPAPRAPAAQFVALSAAGLLAACMTTPLQATPLIWEPDLGEPTTALSGCNDCTAKVALSFEFPFLGSRFSSLHVGTDGCLQLGGLGQDADIVDNMWVRFNAFHADDDGVGLAEPLICPFNGALDLSQAGSIHLREFGDRAVFTWNEVGSEQRPEARLTMQVQLLAEGSIVFAYNGLFDNPGEGLAQSLGGGIVTGISRSTGSFVAPETNPFDLNASLIEAGDTVFQRWCASSENSCSDAGPAGPSGPPIPRFEGEINAAFDLDNHNLMFSPAAGFGYVVSSLAGDLQPRRNLWEPDLGAAVVDVAACDDCQAPLELSFDFPFEGFDYRTVFVGTNGCLQLGSLGEDNEIDYDLWEYFEEFIGDDDGEGDPEPMVCPFGSDLSLVDTGSIHFKDHGDRAVFTWNQVGAYDAEFELANFQAVLFEDGRIVFTYDGIFDGEGEGPQSSLEEGIVVGISLSDDSFPTPELNFDLRTAFEAGSTIYQRWCFEEADSCRFDGSNEGLSGEANDQFDLDPGSVIFTPRPEGGFSVTQTSELFASGFEAPVRVPPGPRD